SNRIEYPEIHEMNIPLHLLERKPKKDPRVFYRFYQLCKKIQPDIIHSWGTMPSVYAVPTTKLLRIKFINASIADAPLDLDLKHPDYFRGRLTYPFSDVVIGNSKAGLKAYKAPAGKSICIYNGFDFNRIKHLENKEKIFKQLNIKTEKLVAMVGGFFERKDYDTYIKAACQVVAQRNDVSFLAIGDGPDLTRCKNIVEKKYTDRILFPGMMQNVESIVNAIDIGVLSTNSKVHQEGISNSILEYMVLGKAVIASAGGGTDEIVVNGQTGILIDALNPRELVAALNRLLDDPKLAKEMGAKGRKRVYEKFTLDRMQEEYLNLYRNLCLTNRQLIS
ncbi:MAG TPA: glycosyltransferase, partial [Saprospiraceae bacterium]|nr:glycosyltransferase [Saprospiraceae bacterium]